MTSARQGPGEKDAGIWNKKATKSGYDKLSMECEIKNTWKYTGNEQRKVYDNINLRVE